jgi:YHS domain-containing protein
MKKIFPILGLAILISAAIITLAITKEAVKDPVCGMEVNPATATFKMDSPHGTIYFCSQTCMEKFQANPSAYMKAGKNEKAIEKAAKMGCEGCADKAKEAKGAAASEASAKSACPMGGQQAMETKTAAGETKVEACSGECGQTQVSAINEFHKLMPVMEAGGVTAIKTSVANMVSRKAAIMEVKCPSGMCPEGFTAVRATFGQKVDALVEVVKTGNDEAINNAFSEMHKAYETLDQMAR